MEYRATTLPQHQQKYLRIGDFGTAHIMESPASTLNKYVGTKEYMAPEVRRCSDHPTPYNPFSADSNPTQKNLPSSF